MVFHSKSKMSRLLYVLVISLTAISAGGTDDGIVTTSGYSTAVSTIRNSPNLATQNTSAALPDEDGTTPTRSNSVLTTVATRHPLAYVADDLYKYGMTLLLIFGCVGNTLALVGLLSPRMRRAPGSLYLITLGFIDQYIIFAAVLGSHVIRSYTGFDYIRHHRWLCKWAYFSIVTCAQSAFYLIAAMSVERALVVSFPFRFMNVFTRKKTSLIIITVVLVWILKNLNIFWAQGAVYEKDANGTIFLKSECGIVDGPLLDFVYRIRPWLDYAITAVAAVTIVISNAIIIVAVLRSMRLQKVSANLKSKEASRKSQQMIPMLIATSAVFLILALPLQIVTIMYPSNPNDVTSDAQAVAKLLWSFGLLTNYMNNGVNFYVYVLSGKKFREELRFILSCGKAKETPHSHTAGKSHASANNAAETRVSTIDVSQQPIDNPTTYNTRL